MDLRDSGLVVTRKTIQLSVCDVYVMYNTLMSEQNAGS